MSAAGVSENNRPLMWKTHFNKDGATNALIRIAGSERIQSLLLDGSTMKKAVWAQVADEMKTLGYDLGPDGGTACHQKWRNLKRAYIMHITKPSSRSPPYIQELQKALQTTKKLLDSTKPQYLSDDLLENDDDIESPAEQSSVFSAVRSYPKQSVHLAEVLAEVVKADKERRKREEEMDKRFEERFNRLEALLTHQNKQLEKFNSLLLKLNNNSVNKRRKLDDEDEEK